MDKKTNTHLAVIQLRLLGYPIKNIRQSLHKLTEISQPEMAKELGLSRQCVTHYMAGRRGRQNRFTEIHENIAAMFGVPTEVLFEDAVNQD
ncbi:MAG: hypothetical protein SWH54_01265 [Thermodesulfobacteriota bacterium]|nr:hypothetical protein [Thermodesulfobacteriota bacterium]